MTNSHAQNKVNMEIHAGDNNSQKLIGRNSRKR